MNILIVSATQFEVKPLLDLLGIEKTGIGLHHSLKNIKAVKTDVLITGIGMVNTAFMMGRYANESYDLIINVGVCGAFDRSIQLGDVVHVTTDILSELGAEDGDDFLTYDAMQLPGEHIFSNQLKQNLYKANTLKQVKGITVNTVHGNEYSIEKVKQIYRPDVESMEGAAFYACCKHITTHYTQIRAVSNYVEKRDKSKWQMPLAIKNLNDYLIELINDI
ncbi:MAG: futalosine hydrolase [Bacteroidota bacterium]